MNNIPGDITYKSLGGHRFHFPQACGKILFHSVWSRKADWKVIFEVVGRLEGSVCRIATA